jgi:hypothetical protein
MMPKPKPMHRLPGHSRRCGLEATTGSRWPAAVDRAERSHSPVLLLLLLLVLLYLVLMMTIQAQTKEAAGE